VKLQNYDFLKEIDLIFTLLSTILYDLFLLTPLLNENLLRSIFGLLLVFFTCGYSLVAALFPGKDDLGGMERFTLSIGMSITVVPLLGLALNFTPFGIRLIPVVVLLSAFTISLSLIAWVRRLRLLPEERFTLQIEKLTKISLGQTTTDKALSIILIATIICSTATLAYVATTPKTGENYTEFYILGSQGKASDYPTNLKPGEQGKIIIGIVNHEQEDSTYRLDVTLNGTTIHTEQIHLTNNEKRETPLSFTATRVGENQKLELLIFKDQRAEPYRTLHLWITVT